MAGRRFQTVCLGLLCLAGAGCGQDAGGSASRQLITLTGSSTMAPLLAEVGKRYEQQRFGVRVDVQSGGTSRGIRDVLSGLADIGLVSRPLTDQDLAVGLVAVPVARDGLALVVHASNPVTELSSDQVVALYAGEIDDWSRLGGDHRHVTVVNRADGRSEIDLFTRFFRMTPSQIAADLVVGENQQAVKTVEGDPSAVVYLSIGTAEYAIARGRPLKLLALDGVEASRATVRDARYPLRRELLLVYRDGALGHEAQGFLSFVQSGSVKDLIQEQSFVPHVD